MGLFFPTARLHRDHSILYALVCEKDLSHMDKNSRNRNLVCKKGTNNLTHIPELHCKEGSYKDRSLAYLNIFALRIRKPSRYKQTVIQMGLSCM